MARGPLPGLPRGRTPIDEKTAANKAADAGHLIEAGWLGLRAGWISDDAPAAQIEEMRDAFFAGAQHLHASMMHGLDDGIEETDDDMRRMESIHDELARFYKDFERRKLKRPTGHLALGLAGHDTHMVKAIDQIDRALRTFAEEKKGMSAAAMATMLSFPLTRLCTHNSEDVSRPMIGAMRVALDALEEVIDKRAEEKRNAN